MSRPCERNIETKVGLITPEITNKLASNMAGFCKLIADLDSIDEIKAVAEAIGDNWQRYLDSA